MCTLQTQITLSLKVATHNLKKSLSMCKKATSVTLCLTGPEVCVDASREVPASVDGHCTGWSRQKSTGVEPVFTVHSFLGKQRVRTMQVTKYLLNNHPCPNICVPLSHIKGIFGFAGTKAKKVGNPCLLTPQLSFLLVCFTSP